MRLLSVNWDGQKHIALLIFNTQFTTARLEASEWELYADGLRQQPMVVKADKDTVEITCTGNTADSNSNQVTYTGKDIGFLDSNGNFIDGFSFNY